VGRAGAGAVGDRALGRVVDEDEVEVGAGGELAEPSLPRPRTTKPPPGTLPCWPTSQRSAVGRSASSTVSAIAVSAPRTCAAELRPRRTWRPAWNWRPCAQRRQTSSIPPGRARRRGARRTRGRAPRRRQGLEEVGREHRVEQVDPGAELARQAGREPVRSAMRVSRFGLARSREKICTPLGNPARNSSSSRKAASRSGCRARARRIAGVSSVSSSLARVLRVARMWPWCQP
jgi:hypothetical protein